MSSKMWKNSISEYVTQKKQTSNKITEQKSGMLKCAWIAASPIYFALYFTSSVLRKFFSLSIRILIQNLTVKKTT